MGNFYVNLAVGTDDAASVASKLATLPDTGVVAPAEGGWTVLSSRNLEYQDEAVIDQYGTSLSRDGAPVLAAMNHDDDMLMLALFRDGARVAYANTWPGAVTGEDNPPVVEGAASLAALKDGVTPDDVSGCLTGEQLFAVETHQTVAGLLGLPRIAAGFGYRYWQNGEFGQDGYLPFGTG